METFSSLMLIGLLGVVISAVICYFAQHILDFLKYKVSKPSNSICLEKIFDISFYVLCNRMYIVIISLILSLIPIIYLTIEYGFVVLTIIISIQFILHGINFFEEYIIAKNLHKFMIEANEIVPESYYKAYFSEWSDNLLLNELLASIVENMKMIIQIIKKEPLEMYF